MRWAGYVARMSEKRNLRKFVVNKPEVNIALARSRNRSKKETLRGLHRSYIPMWIIETCCAWERLYRTAYSFLS